MSRRRRWLPPPQNAAGVWMVEVTARTVGGLYLLRPDGRLNRRAIGVLARAQAYAGVEVYAAKVMSSHHHLDVGVRDGEQFATFECFVQANLAKEANQARSGRLAAPLAANRWPLPADNPRRH